jgi:uncharacterized protein YndB with AHSA1/START domain
MVEHTESTRIAKPAEAVWALVGEPAAWPRWAGDLNDVRVHGELGAGTRVTYTYRRRRVAVTLTRYEPGRLVEIAGSETSYDMRESIGLEAAAEQMTTVSITIGFEPKATWARLVAPLVVPFKGVVLGRSLRRSLHELRRTAEGA